MNPLRAGAAEFAGHSVQFVLASGAYCPAAHAAHVALLSAAKVVEYVPTEHLVQFAVPFVALYVPGGHIAHCPLDAPVSGPVYPVLHEHPMPDEQDCAVPSHGTLVRSTPSFIALAMASTALEPKYSSTTNTPARSAFKYWPPQLPIFKPCPIQVFDTVLSVIGEEAITLETTPFAVTEHIFVDER
jgi:hypothetical protein